MAAEAAATAANATTITNKKKTPEGVSFFMARVLEYYFQGSFFIQKRNEFLVETYGKTEEGGLHAVTAT